MQKFKKKHGYPPGALLIGKEVGMSKESVRQMIGIMVKNGYLQHQKTVQAGAYHPVDN